MLVDYHMHLAPDGEPLTAGHFDDERLAPFVQAAAERGVDEICLTEHCYRFAEARGILDHPVWNAAASAPLDAYVELLQRAAADGLPVRTGIELDWLAGQEERLGALLDGRPFDLVLGSVHTLRGGMVDHPDHAIWDAYPVADVYERYFAAVAEAARSGLFDVMAHLDLAKVFGHRPPDGPPVALYEQAADAVADAGVAVEISTAGLRKPARELYPAPALLAELARRDVPITLASDAHQPSDVGRDYGAALRLAHDAGYRHVAAFRGRERRQEPLG